MKYRLRLIALSLLLLVFSGHAYALKCGTHIIKIGERTHQVLDACGEPDFIDHYERDLGYPYHPIHIEVWTYNYGRRKFMQELVFENGRLKKINQLDYGY